MYEIILIVFPSPLKNIYITNIYDFFYLRFKPGWSNTCIFLYIFLYIYPLLFCWYFTQRPLLVFSHFGDCLTLTMTTNKRVVEDDRLRNTPIVATSCKHMHILMHTQTKNTRIFASHVALATLSKKGTLPRATVCAVTQ